MIILGTNSIKDTGYDVANSVRFNKPDVPYLHKALSSGNRKTWTYSCWVKRSLLGVNQYFLPTQADPGNANAMGGSFNVNDKIDLFDYNAPSVSAQIITNRVFRDPNAWYHIAIIVDTTQSSANDRLKMFVNGVDERTAGGYSTDTMPSLNYDFNINESSHSIYIGTYFTSSPATSQFDGYMSEVVFLDGTAAAIGDLGEFDSDSPTIWKPKDVSGLTPGTNGFYLDFEDSSNLGNDVFGGTDLTEVNLAATDQSTDTCTNNFCTLNPLFPNSGLTFSEGNLNVVASDANYRHAVSSMAVQSGKWYAEFKAVSGFSSVDKNVGIYRTDNVYSATTGLGNYTTGTTWCYGATGNVRTNNSNNDTGEATFTNGDIISIAMDLDNNKLYFAKNNSWINSGDPTSGSTGTGAYAIVAGNFYHFAVTTISSGGAALWSCNFGSPSYANSSDASDANGYGAFEYAPPSGYLSLCTKNLGSDGG